MISYIYIFYYNLYYILHNIIDLAYIILLYYIMYFTIYIVFVYKTILHTYTISNENYSQYIHILSLSLFLYTYIYIRSDLDSSSFTSYKTPIKNHLHRKNISSSTK